MDLQTQWRGQRDTGARRRLWRLLFISLLIHIPLTPFAGLIGLLSWLAPPTGDPLDLGPIRAIPIDALIDDSEIEPKKAPPAEPKGTFVLPPKPVHKPKPKVVKHDEPDAGVPEAGADAGAPEAGPDAGNGSDAAAPKSITDPVALVGAAGKVADANANVRLIINGSVIRAHPLGAKIGALLASVYQWRDFFGPARVDPIRDIDRMYIAGPQLRDSSNVVVILQYNTSQQRMKAAVDALVRRDPNGKWLQTRVPAAVARADRAERYFVFPGPHMVVVTPPSASKSALELGPNKKIPPPKHGEALTAYVITPWRVFMGMPLPFRFPETIKWARVQVIPKEDGGVVAEFEAEDSSEGTAARDAKYLEGRINSVAHVNLGVLSVILGHGTSDFIDEVSFSSDGAEIHGTLRANASQVSMLFDLIGAAIAQYQHEPTLPGLRRPLPRPAPSASTSVPTP